MEAVITREDKYPIARCIAVGDAGSEMGMGQKVLSEKTDRDRAGGRAGYEARSLPASKPVYRAYKRVFDIVFSAIVIVIGFIPGVVLAIAIRRESPGSPIYVQKRVNGVNDDGTLRTFKILKFRSMYADAEERLKELKAAGLNDADGPLFKMRDDPRVTGIGKFIRKHSIDEMPQFLNAFAGQISVVGPRPPLPEEVACYDERGMRTLSVKPGITSYWQVSGRSDTTFAKKIELDNDYIDDRSTVTDLKLIAKTVAIVVTGGALTRNIPSPAPWGFC